MPHPQGWGGGAVSNSLLCFAYALVFEAGFDTVSQISLELTLQPRLSAIELTATLLPLPLEFLSDRCVPPHLACFDKLKKNLKSAPPKAQN